MNYLFPNFQQKSAFSKVSYLLLIIVVSFVVVTLLGLIIAVPIFGIDVLKNMGAVMNFQDKESISFIKYFQVINQFGIFILPAFLFAFLVKNKPFEYLRLDNKFRLHNLLLSILIIVSALSIINWMVQINEQMKLPDFLIGIENWMKESEEKTKQLTDLFLDVDSISGLIVNLFIIAFLAALGEELLFRGVILKLLAEWTWSIHWGILISATIFSAMHMQFYGFLPRLALGVIFGYIFIWSGSLWVPIILHFLFNSMTVIASYLHNINAIAIDPDSIGTSSSAISIIGSLLISIVLMVILYRKRDRSDHYQFTLQKKEEPSIEDSSIY